MPGGLVTNVTSELVQCRAYSAEAAKARARTSASTPAPRYRRSRTRSTIYPEPSSAPSRQTKRRKKSEMNKIPENLQIYLASQFFYFFGGLWDYRTTDFVRGKKSGGRAPSIFHSEANPVNPANPVKKPKQCLFRHSVFPLFPTSPLSGRMRRRRLAHPARHRSRCVRAAARFARRTRARGMSGRQTPPSFPQS